jgi:hypothetical protein
MLRFRSLFNLPAANLTEAQMLSSVQVVRDPWVVGMLAFALLFVVTLSWWIIRQRWSERKYRQKVARRRSASKDKALARKEAARQSQNPS